MGRDKFKFHLLPSIALFPFAAVAFELTVTDFVRGYNTAVGKIGYCNVKGGDVLYAAVGGLPLDSLHFFLIQDNFCRGSDTAFCPADGVAASTVLVDHFLISPYSTPTMPVTGTPLIEVTMSAQE